MTTLQDLVTLVEDNPLNPICAGMLADELMELKDLTRAQADVQVAKVQEVAIAAAFLRRASEIINGCPWQRCWARDIVLEAIGTEAGRPVTILLVAGLQSPQMYASNTPETFRVWGEGTATVGAQWIVRQYREYVAWRTLHNREMREAKRK